MHPILASGGRVAIYVAFWLLVGFLLATLLASQAPFTWGPALLISLPLAIMYGFVCLSAWYVARSMPLGGTSFVRISATVMTAALASSALWLLIARAWAALLRVAGAVDVLLADVQAIYTVLFGLGVLLYLLSLAVGYLLVTFEQSRAAERRGFEVQVFAREAELRSLRAQIDPHFLFNSLHSISALTTIDAQAARRMCVLLADFFRESVALGGEAQITLAQEFRLVERFLEVEKVRFAERLRVEMDIGEAGAALVPPLLLQPVVENAVTHGIAHTLDGGTLRIAASCTPSQLRVVVENPCDPERPRRTGTGVGLANVRSRLRALHGDNAWIATSEQDGLWRAEVVVPLAERSETSETSERSETSEKPERPEKSESSERSETSETSEKPERPE
jgi:two-component system sensor histidine kinase AlgZ